MKSMNNLNKCIRQPHYPKKGQLGGVQRNHPYTYNGHTIYYNSRPNNDGDPETIFINAGHGKGQNPCFNLALKDGAATLQSLDKGADCFEDGFDNTKEMVMAAFSLAKSKGCTVFQLTDNSTKTCHSYKFTLSDMYFVTTGRTWYESILSVKIKDYSEFEMSAFREKVRTSTWADVSAYLISKGKVIEFDFPGLDPNKNGSCMEALNVIAKMRNVLSCKFFADCLEYIMDAHNLKSFHGKVWSVKIDLPAAKGTRKSRASKVSKGSQGTKGTRKSSSKMS